MKLLSLISYLGLTSLASALNNTCSTATFQSFLQANGTIATVSLARAIETNGTFVVTGNAPYPKSPTGLQALCAVEVNVTSEAGTHYSFGLFLPEAWNERFL